MLTIFDRVPPLFVEMYDFQFRVWAREFRQRGMRQAIEFVRPPSAPVVLDAHGQPVVLGAWFEAEIDSIPGREARVIIRPASERDQEAIERHCREMWGMVLQ